MSLMRSFFQGTGRETEVGLRAVAVSALCVVAVLVLSVGQSEAGVGDCFNIGLGGTGWVCSSTNCTDPFYWSCEYRHIPTPPHCYATGNKSCACSVTGSGSC